MIILPENGKTLFIESIDLLHKHESENILKKKIFCFIFSHTTYCVLPRLSILSFAAGNWLENRESRKTFCNIETELFLGFCVRNL